MAKRITVNMNMVDALKKMLRMDTCNCCGQEWSYHAWFETKGVPPEVKVVRCSNTLH